ncbi:MAG: metallophosphoesterase [Candidatus Methanomethylophilus sp.]|nr:metallophosphoesterase [Methanomethylophilus sp.]
MNDNGITIIPDVHGRSFWRDAFRDGVPGRTVFLGDYLDPYLYEGVTRSEATDCLREIISLKRENPDRIVLLLGNHDLGYLSRRVCQVRMDYGRERMNRRLLEDNLDLFDIVHEETLGGVRFLFSHAGVGQEWERDNREALGGRPFTAAALNAMLHDPGRRDDLLGVLAQAGAFRGGTDPHGSPVWADVDEFLCGDTLLPGYFHVFGHSMLSGGPLAVGQDGVCVDCRTVFRLEDSPLRIEPAGLG